MKRTALLFILALLLCACVPTPEQEFVVNKADGELETLIGEATPVPDYAEMQTLRDMLGVPDSVVKAFTTQVYGGTLDVSVDAAVVMPKVSTVPVFSAAIGWDAMKDRTGIVHALLGDEVYRVDYQRAAVLAAEAEIVRYNDWLAELAAGTRHTDLSEEDEREWLQQNLSAAMSSRSMHLEKAGEPVPWDGSLTPYEGDYGFVCLYHEPYLLEFHASDAFQYVWFKDLTADVASVASGRAPQADDAPAIAAAQAFCAEWTDTPLEPFAAETHGVDRMLVLAPTRAGIPCLPLRSYHGDDMGYDAANGQEYERRMQQETLSVTVRDGKVLYFAWESPLYITGTENENVVLKPFDEIMNIFQSHIRAAYYLNFDERTGESAFAKVCITSIRLSYARVDKKDSDEYYLLPVWDFLGYDQYYGTENDPDLYAQRNAELPKNQWNSTFLTINAIDGSVIDRNKGY